MNIATNIFSKGMDQDTHPSLLEKSKYIFAQNMRLSATEGSDNGVLTNVKGTKNLFYLGNDKVIGYCTMQDDLILFTKQEGSTIADKLWKVTQDKTASGTVVSSYDVLVQKPFGFSLDNPIEAVSRYENEYAQKIYWVDGVNNTRFVNIAPVFADGTVNDLSALAVDDFELLPNASFGSIELDEIGGGSMPIGSVQYAYQYFSRSGSESVISPSSRVFHVATSSENLTYPAQYRGSAPDDNNGNSGKSYRIKLKNLDTSFDKIRVLGIYYNTLGQEPTIKIITERNLTSSEISVTDSGANYIGEYTVEEFSIASSSVFTAKHLETKDNYLFAANIKENNFVVPTEAFDSRAYRFKSASATADPRRALLYNAQGGIDIGLSGIAPVNWEGVMPEWDCINSYNNIDNDDDDDHRFIYKTDGATIGGEGKNISYEFKLDYVSFIQGDRLDTASNQTRIVAKDAGVTEVKGAVRYSSPDQSGEMRSYRRDEIYRFAIVFIDKLGRESDAKWIGDIRMPACHDINSQPTWQWRGSNRYNYTLMSDDNLYTLSIQWDVDLSDMYANHRDVYDQINGFRIVRVPRESNDRTIITQGLLSPYMRTYYDPNDTGLSQGDPSSWPHTRHARVVHSKSYTAGSESYDGKVHYYDKDQVEFMSPEVLINKNITTSTNDRLSLVGGLYKPEQAQYPRWGLSTQRVNSFDRVDIYEMNSGDKRLPDTFIESSEIVGVKTMQDQFSAGGVTNMYNAVIDPDDGEGGDDIRYRGPGGTHLAMKLSEQMYPNLIKYVKCTDNTTISGSDSENHYLFVNYKRPNIIYGGNSYNDRFNNKYIATTGIINKTSGTVSLRDFGGDTFLSMFIYLRCMYEGGSEIVGNFGNEVGYFQVLAIPVESSINCDIRHDKHLGTYFGTDVYNKDIWGFLSWKVSGDYFTISTGTNDAINDSNGLILMRETSADGKARWGDQYPDELTDLYQYNTVYSTEQTTKYFYPRASDVIDNVDSDVRVLVSDIKINGETSDSWTKFRVNNYLEVDAKYGSINKLLSHGQHLYFFQKDAVGVLSTNQREVISTSNPGSLQLGTGTVLSRYDYITTDSGTRHGKSVFATPFGVFYYDAEKYKLMMLGQASVSDLKGMHSWLRENVGNDIIFNDNTLNGNGVTVGYDYENNELLFTFKGTSNIYTLVYNTLIGVFTSFYTAESTQYIQWGDKLLSSEDNARIFVHNEGSYGNFGLGTNKSTLKLSVNDNYIYTKVFDSVHFDTICTNSSNEDKHETFSDIRITNTYQDSGLITLGSTNITRRDRTWSLSIPRNNGNTDRIRDKYAIVELNYNNFSNYKLSVPYISTRYRINYR